MGELFTIYDNLLSAELLVVLRIKDVRNGTGDRFVVVTVAKLLHLLRIQEETLETRNEGEIAEKASRFRGRSEPRLLAETAMLEVCMFAGVSHARIWTAMVPLWFDSRQNRDSVNHHPV
jgi:hypothetical protein